MSYTINDGVGSIWGKLTLLERNQDKILSRLDQLESARDEPYDVMDSFRSSKIERDAGEPVNKYYTACLSKEQISDKLLFDKEREIEKLRESNRRLYESNFQLRTENDDKTYWVEQAEKLQHAYSDLRWRWDNQPVVEKQTARACTEIVNRIKNDSLTTAVRDVNSKEWMIAICEDIKREIKQEFDLK